MAWGESLTIHLRGRILLDGEREVGDLWVRDGCVALTRPSAPGPAMAELEGWVLPGLVDAHCHIGLGPGGPVPAAVARQQAITERDAGVLAIRDAGSPVDTRWVDDAPDLPRLLRAGRHLARPKRYLRGFGRELTDVGQLPSAVRAEARRGTGWVKLVGDWIDRDLGEGADLAPLWPAPALAAAVAAAHAEAARVTVHAFTAEVIGSLLAAGVDCIEHGTGIPTELMPEVAARGIAVTPTLLQVGTFAEIAARADGKFPRYAERMRSLHARRYRQVRDLNDAGVRLLVGTDAGGTIEHGRIADECAELVAAGIPPAEVVAMATWRARDYLGLAGIVDGASADLVVYPADPRADIAVLRRPRAIILRGRLMGPVAG